MHMMDMLLNIYIDTENKTNTKHSYSRGEKKKTIKNYYPVQLTVVKAEGRKEKNHQNLYSKSNEANESKNSQHCDNT